MTCQNQLSEGDGPISRKINDLEFIVGGKELLPEVKVLWEELRDHHSELNAHFGAEIADMQFEERINKLLLRIQDGLIRIELAREPSGAAIAYSMSSTRPDGAGEVDSLFVHDGWRGNGLGELMTERGLVWLAEQGADPLIIEVLVGNERVLDLYRRFGFEPRRILMTRPKEKN